MSGDQPEFSPMYLPVAVAALLRDDSGVACRPGAEKSPTAVNAAADLLTALGVTPAAVPKQH
jgi:hypothetical protein